MATTEPIQLIERDRRRRRWVIRFALLGLLLMVLVGFVAALLLQSSSFTPDELRAILEALPEHSSRQDIERILGKQNVLMLEANPQQCCWRFYHHTWNTLDEMFVIMQETADASLVFKSMNVTRLEGKDAWQYRWDLIKWRLGIK